MPSSPEVSQICKLTFFVSRSCSLSQIYLHPDDLAVFRVKKPGAFGVVNAPLFSGTIIISIFQAVPFDPDLSREPVTFDQNINWFKHLVDALVTCSPKVHNILFPLESSFARMFKYGVMVVVSIKKFCLITPVAELFTICLELQFIHLQLLFKLLILMSCGN